MACPIFAIRGSGKYESSLEEIPNCSPSTVISTHRKEGTKSITKKSHLHINTDVGQICQGIAAGQR